MRGRVPQQRPRRPTGRPGCWVRSSVRYLVDWQAAFASRLAPTGSSSGPAITFSSQEKGDPKVALVRYCPNCRPRPPGTPWISVSSHGPFGLIDRLQPLSQR